MVSKQQCLDGVVSQPGDSSHLLAVMATWGEFNPWAGGMCVCTLWGIRWAMVETPGGSCLLSFPLSLSPAGIWLPLL